MIERIFLLGCRRGPLLCPCFTLENANNPHDNQVTACDVCPSHGEIFLGAEERGLGEGCRYNCRKKSHFEMWTQEAASCRSQYHLKTVSLGGMDSVTHGG